MVSLLIARNATQGIELIQSLLNKVITVHVLNMGLMDNTPIDKLIRSVMLTFAEFERDMIVERTQESKATAKQREGFTEGRRPVYSKEQLAHDVDLLETYSYGKVVKMTGISKSTLVRERKKHKA